jgi:hypothetical protein
MKVKSDFAQYPADILATGSKRNVIKYGDKKSQLFK